MPEYQYHCKECKTDKVLFQTMDEPHIAKCECGQNMHRVFYPVKFKLKGPPRWWDPKRGVKDAEYDRHAHLRMLELKGEKAY